MDESKRNLWVGLTTLAGVVGLLALLMMFGYAPLVLERFYEVRIELPNATGLHEGSRVNLSGIDVGQVRSVELREPPGNGVVVTVGLREDVRVPVTAVAEVETPLFGGGPMIELVVPEDPTGPVTFLPLDGSARVPGRVGSFATVLSDQLRVALAQPISDFERVARDLGRLSAEWTKVGDNVNNLLEMRGVEPVDRGQAVANLSTVLVRLDQRLAELEPVVSGVRQYVQDAQIREDIKMTASNAREVSEQVAGVIDEVSATFQGSVETLERRYLAVADDLSAAVGVIRSALDKVHAGEGTVGALLNDPVLYQSLTDAARRTQAAIDDLRLLVQKWRDEGLPVHF